MAAPFEEVYVAQQVVLIADADETERNRLAEMLSGHGLKCIFAVTYDEVIARCDIGINCLVVDPDSAEINAKELFKEIDSRGSIPIFVTSSGGSREDVIQALQHGCLDWLSKPVDAAAVEEALRRVSKRTDTKLIADRASGKALVGRALIKEIALRIREGNIDLPEVPTVVKELNEVLQNLESDAEEVRGVIEKDPSLSARLIATVNTATYGGNNWQGRITDLHSCVTRLGNLTIRNLVQTEAIKEMFQFRSPAFKAVFDKMWRAQFMSACLCRETALAVNLPEPEEMYLMALMHNIGELFLLRVFGEIFQRQNNQILSMDEVLEMVRDYHTVFGEGLMKKWDLGAHFSYVTRYHHDLEEYQKDDEENAEYRKMMHAINLADQLVIYVGADYHAKSLPGPPLPESYQALGVTPEAKDKLRTRAETMFQELFVKPTQ